MLKKFSLSIFGAFAVIMLLLLSCGCSGDNNKDKGESTTKNSLSTKVDETSTHSEEFEDIDSDDATDEMTADEFFEDIDSDGIIDEMTAEEFAKKLSKLSNETTMGDLPKIFGKFPQMVQDVDINAWRYFSGNLIITLDGISLVKTDKLDRIIVENKDSSITCLYLDLTEYANSLS